MGIVVGFLNFVIVIFGGGFFLFGSVSGLFGFVGIGSGFISIMSNLLWMFVIGGILVFGDVVFMVSLFFEEVFLFFKGILFENKDISVVVIIIIFISVFVSLFV